MSYSEEALAAIEKNYLGFECIHDRTASELMAFHAKLKNERAKEYLAHGVGRRISTLVRCIKNIFTIFPVTRTNHLTSEELKDTDINIHAFFINIAGIFDNLGWVFVHEKNLLGKLKDKKVPQRWVGLFYTSTQNHLAPELRHYLTSEPIKSWYEDYSKIYRDSLAHRIPLYIPPSLLTDEETKLYQEIEREIETLSFSKNSAQDKIDKLMDTQQKLGKVSHLFAHSMNEGSKPVYFHAQVLTDFSTIDEIIEKFCKYF